METPQPGEYYYHFKHDPEVLEDHAYRIIGVAIHSETEEKAVVYKPLYTDNFPEKNGVDFMVRPLAMFVDEVTRDGKTFKRFSKISDEKLIAQLKIREFLP